MTAVTSHCHYVLEYASFVRCWQCNCL